MPGQRAARQVKIDRQHARDTGGFNVKLGRGGIREIEFIAQALQLAFGGRDAWLRAPHTLISLGRLADRQLITERERTELSDAYLFLRQLEHRLQMEHGLQTHSVPDEPTRRLLIARRLNFAGYALAEFDRALELHTTHVRSAYDRVFGKAVEESALKKSAQDLSRARPAVAPCLEKRLMQRQPPQIPPQQSSPQPDRCRASVGVQESGRDGCVRKLAIAQISDTRHRLANRRRALRQPPASRLARQATAEIIRHAHLTP